MSASTKTATAGFTALLVIAVIAAINFLVGGIGVGNFRTDITEDGLYTLSQGTKNIINGIKAGEPVTIKFYSTSDDRVMPNVLKPHARTIEDLLLEYEKQSNDNIILEVIHPNPDTDDEDKAKEDDVQGMQVNQQGDKIYLGMTIQSLDRKEILPFLSPDDATSLEYEVSRAIAKLTKPNKTVIGYMSALPVGGAPGYQMMRAQGQRAQEPWAFIQQLRADYEVRDVPMTTDKIDSDITVLLVIHAADITETTEFAIDQYLLGGGNVVAFVDPQSLLAQASGGQPNPMTGQPGQQINTSSDLQNLFKAWGINFKKDMIVADMNYRGNFQGRINPTFLQIPSKAINKDNPISSGLQSLSMISAGALDLDKKEGLTSEILASSSEVNELIDTTAAEKLRREDLTNFSSSGKKQVLGVRITGKFKTAFPNGRPAAPGAPKESGGAEQDATAPATATSAPAAAAPQAASTPVTVTTPPISVTTAPVSAAPAPATPAPAISAVPSSAGAPATPVAAPAAAAKPAEVKKDDSLKEAKDIERNVIVFSDADMLYDAFCLRQGDLGVGLVANGGNLPMVLNAVERLAGGGDLIQIRNRKSPIREFSKLKEMRQIVEQDYRPKLISLAAERQKIADALSKARPQLDLKKGTIILDDATMKNIKEMEKNSRNLEREERDIRKKVNKEVEFSKSLLKFLNLLAVPLLVGCIGLLLALRRRALTAAV